jgi:thioredoxin-related protein
MTAVERFSIALMLSAALCAGAEQPWRDDVDVAISESANRPIALLFSTEDCVYCHRMLDESADSQEVRQALNTVTGIHVQAEKARAMTNHFGIRSFPSLVLINRKGQFVRAVSGYLSSEDLATALRILALHGDSDGQRPAGLRSAGDIAAILAGENPIEKLVGLLGDGNTEERRELRDELAKIPAARPALWSALESERLGVRVDAAAVLARDFANPANYDPFAGAAEQQEKIAAWKRAAEIAETP